MLLVLAVVVHGEQRRSLRARGLRTLGANRLLGEQGELPTFSTTTGTARSVTLPQSPHPHSLLALDRVVSLQRIGRIEFEGFVAIVGGAGSEVGSRCSEAHANGLYVAHATKSSPFSRRFVQKGESSRAAKKQKRRKPSSSRKTPCLFQELLIEAEAEESTTTTAEETPQQQKLQQQTQKQKKKQKKKGQSVARKNRAPT